MASTTTCILGTSHAKALFENSKLAHSLISWNANNYRSIPRKLENLQNRVTKIVLFISPLTHRGKKQGDTYVFDPLNLGHIKVRFIGLLINVRKLLQTLLLWRAHPEVNLTWIIHGKGNITRFFILFNMNLK